MQRRYFSLQRFFKKLQLKNGTDFLPSTKEHSGFLTYLSFLTKYDNFTNLTKILPRGDINISQERSLFDPILVDLLSTRLRLQAETDICHSDRFQSELRKKTGSKRKLS